jgi:hypothetical protein
LAALYEKYRARGLEIIGLCTNPERDREKVVDFIKANGLTWPQFHDGRGAQGEIFEAFFGALPPRYCVIDRQGKVTALVLHMGGSGVENAVVKALGTP